MQVVSRCRSQKIAITVSDVLRTRTIQKLAACSKPIVDRKPPILADSEALGPWPLSPIQQLFFKVSPGGLNHFNQTFLLRVADSIEPESLVSALEAVMQRHPMLRVRFERTGPAQWQQALPTNSKGGFVFREYALSQDTKHEVATISQQRQRQLDILQGPLFAADLFTIQDEQQALLLTAHHLVIDLVSWRIIWHDLEQYLKTQADLPPEPISFRQWCQIQVEESSRLSPEEVLPFAINPAPLEFWAQQSTHSADRTF